MAVTVNRKGLTRARALIADGKINEGAWSFSAADGNKLLGDNDWAEYGRWFLAVDSDADPETRDHYKYPFGKDGEIYRRGVIAAKSRATQQGLAAVADAADGLLTAIDQKLGNEAKSLEVAERRFLQFAGAMRAEKREDGAMIIEGYPIVYETYAPLWGFREIIRKGAATEALKRSDELVLWDHDSGQPMARHSNGTLEAKEDDHGVFIRADVSKTRWGRDGYEAIAAGIINRMSFAFDVASQGDRWYFEEVEGVKIETREILQFDRLWDYSPVSYPAYTETVVMARCKDLALRRRPEPEASGDDSRSLLEVAQADGDLLGYETESINLLVKEGRDG